MTTASEELDDLPSSITIGQMIGGLADMALVLNGYTISVDTINSECEVFCQKCGQRTVARFREMTTLELLNDVLEHFEANHRDDKNRVHP